jgi:glycosyltransferase involved in cell wall biosynthesis
MIKTNDKKFVSIIWGYSPQLYNFSAEENYHLHILNIARNLGYKTYVIIKGTKTSLENDPNFDLGTEVIDYKNIFHFLFQIVKFSIKKSLFYVNSYEWQSFLIPFLSRKTIFMAHSQPIRKNKAKQYIQNFVYIFFKTIRLNNESEKDFLIKQRINKGKLFVIPLIVSQKIFHIIDDRAKRSNLVYFGNVTKVKNLETILKALKEVATYYPSIKLNIVGEVYDNEFVDQINNLNLNENIILHGHKAQNEQLTNLLNTTIISINSSISEGQCVSVYDTALCGNVLCLPKIMSFTGVFKDTALFHDIHDHKALAQNIITYLKNPQLTQEHRRKNIEMINKNYSKEAVEKKLRNLILKI